MRFYLILLLWLPLNGLPIPSRHPAPQKSREVVHDAFIASLLQHASYQRLLAAKYPVTKATAHVGSGSIVRFSHGPNQFACFRSPSNTFTVSFTITSPEPVLAPVLTLGTAKKEILRRFGVTNTLNTLRVTDLEGMALATLSFQQEKLTKITFQATMD